MPVGAKMNSERAKFCSKKTDSKLAKFYFQFLKADFKSDKTNFKIKRLNSKLNKNDLRFEKLFEWLIWD